MTLTDQFDIEDAPHLSLNEMEQFVEIIMKPGFAETVVQIVDRDKDEHKERYLDLQLHVMMTSFLGKPDRDNVIELYLYEQLLKNGEIDIEKRVFQ